MGFLVPISVVCTHCQTTLEVSDAFAGKKGRCPTCQAVVDIPAASDTIVVTCQECHAQLEVAASFAGKMGRCPACQAVMPIPGIASGPAPPPAREEPELAAKPSVRLSTTRYVPYEEERPRPKPAERTAEKPPEQLAPLRMVDEEALLQLPPCEPATTLVEITAAAAALTMQVPAARPPPPRVSRHKLPVAAAPLSQSAAPAAAARARLEAAIESEVLESLSAAAPMPPSATPAPSDPTAELPPKRKQPPVLIPPPGPSPPASDNPPHR